MTNMTEAAEAQIDELIRAAYEKAAAKGALPGGCELGGTIEAIKDPSFGDYACSYAMAAARSMKTAPRKIAEALTVELTLDGTYFKEVSVAGPGFINFRLSDKWYWDVLRAVEQEGAQYGCSNLGKGKKVMVEFVSANPTGPMHMGNARGGVLGDSLAAVLKKTGYDTWKEFYVNDSGNQIHKFAQSIEARYLQRILGEDAVPFPEDGYHGDDIREIAEGFYRLHGDSYLHAEGEKRLNDMAEYGLGINIPKMESDLKRYGIVYDKWFFESSLHESGYVDETVKKLVSGGWTYEKDGALWLKTAELLRNKYLAMGKTEEQIEKLDLKDDVLCRGNGVYTYFAADIAYHRNKLEKRGFDTVINIWGADHHGHVARLQAALDALGLDGSTRIVVVLMQLVNLLRDGEAVRMSKRTGKAIALCDLLDEVSVDAARYFFNSRAFDSHLNFDLGLAVREDSDNPVYYVQYAHARICSLVKMLGRSGDTVKSADEIHVSALSTEMEHELIKQLAAYPEELKSVAKSYDTSRINSYVLELSAKFHKFYNACRIKGEEETVLNARLKLADTVRAVIENCLGLLGVGAPDQM